MDDKFQNKYRISSARLQNWDYGWNASYFITICAKNREHYFGEIVNGIMHFSEIGKIVESEWVKSPDIRPDMNLELDVFVVMPNHFHGIVTIGKNKYNQRDGGGGGDDCGVGRRDAMNCVSTDTDTKIKNQFGPQRRNLASIIRGFKSAVTIQARQINADFAWQPRFNDHIIRNNQSFKRIQNYINTNIKIWKNDDFFI